MLSQADLVRDQVAQVQNLRLVTGVPSHSDDRNGKVLARTLQAERQDERASDANVIEQLRQALAAAEKSQARLEAMLEAATSERDELRRELATERADRATADARYHQQVAQLTGTQAHTQGALDATVAERDQLRADLTEARLRLTDPG